MAIQPLVESAILFIIGLVGFIETFNLAKKISPTSVSDVLGPDKYILGLSVLLMFTAVLHVYANYKDVLRIKKVRLGKAAEIEPVNIKVIYMLFVFAIYIALIHVLGYSLSTLIFVFLQFRLAGVTSLRANVILSVVVTIFFHLLFIQYFDLQFPKSLFFR